MLLKLVSYVAVGVLIFVLCLVVNREDVLGWMIIYAFLASCLMLSGDSRCLDVGEQVRLSQWKYYHGTEDGIARFPNGFGNRTKTWKRDGLKCFSDMDLRDEGWKTDEE